MLADDRLVVERRDDIIRVYYDALIETLRKINYRGDFPAMLDVQIALMKAAPIDLMNCFFIIPPRFFNIFEFDLGELLENVTEAFKLMGEKVYENPEFRKYLLERFTKLELTGVMDG